MKTVVYAGTENLYDAMRVSCTSLLANNQIDRVYFLIEHDFFPFNMPDNVKTINVSKQAYFTPEGANYKTRWTYMSLLRLALTKIFPHNKRVLWLDCDTIVNGDISELFSLDMGSNYFAGAKETDKSHERTYINAGVLLINLEQIRKDGFDNRIIDIVNHNHYSLPDQDAINEQAQGRILPISGMYNVCPFTEQTYEKKIYHFAANRFFRSERMYIKYKDWSEKG